MIRRPVDGERGSATLELAILAPALLVLVALAVVAGRITLAAGTVEHAATVAAREASLARTATAARAAATDAARASLAEQGVDCAPLTVTVDTTGFAVTVGQPAQVRATVTCTVPLAGLAVPGLPGARTLTAEMASPLDTWRGR